MENNIPDKNSKDKNLGAKEKISGIKAVVGSLYESLPVDDMTDLQLDITQFARKLREKYPDNYANYANYAIYHALIGSTAWDRADTVYDDFTGEDSVENFVKGLVEKYKK